MKRSVLILSVLILSACFEKPKRKGSEFEKVFSAAAEKDGTREGVYFPIKITVKNISKKAYSAKSLTLHSYYLHSDDGKYVTGGRVEMRFEKPENKTMEAGESMVMNTDFDFGYMERYGKDEFKKITGYNGYFLFGCTIDSVEGFTDSKELKFKLGKK